MSHRSASVIGSHDNRTIARSPWAHSETDLSTVGQAPWDTRSSAIAGGMVGGSLAGFVYGERLLARTIGCRLATAMPGGSLLWRMAAHGAALAGLAAGGHAIWNRAMRGLDPGALSTRLVEPGSQH